MNYQKYIIKQGDNELGIPWKSIERELLTPSQYDRFMKFMEGQTCCEVDGVAIVYTRDFERFIRGLPVVD